MSLSKIDKRNIRILSGWLGVLFIAAALSQARVQVFARNNILETAEKSNRFILSHQEEARRGTIYSSDGKALAQDELTYQFGIDFEKSPQSDTFFMELSAASGIPAADFKSLCASGARSRYWLEPLSQAQAREVQDVKLSWRADGVSIARTGRRYYPLGEAAAGVTGAVREEEAVVGLESSQDEYLAGSDGLTVGIVDRTGAFLPMRLDPSSKRRIDGQNIVLTIDSELQRIAADAVHKAVESNDADSGIAIVMDPKTGDILAMANWPSFDPNGFDGKRSGQERWSDFNPNYRARLEPGSTFKILTLAKAIDDEKTTLDQTIECKGVLSLGKAWRVRCDLHHGSRAHGVVDGEAAIAKSCNVSAATWAVSVGREPFLKYIEDLGLLQKTDIGLPHEAAGLFNYDEYAKTLQLANVGFGQSISVTPLALASAFSMIGNNGQRMNPRLIQKVGDKIYPVESAGQIVRGQTAEEVLSCMRAVIQSDSGTGKALRIPGYELAGKTGTAQKINQGEDNGYVSNFVGFVPAVEPRAMILVMVDNPKAGRYYGASVAGPVFHDLARAVIRRFDIPKQKEVSVQVPTDKSPSSHQTTLTTATPNG